MNRHAKFCVRVVIATIIVCFSFSVPHNEKLIMPDFTDIPPVYIANFADLKQNSSIIPEVIIEENAATLKNGYDSDISEITIVPYTDIDELAVPFLEKEIPNKNNLIGWFEFEGPASIKGLPINGPLMFHSADITYYLDHDENNKYNSNGSIYVDFENNPNDLLSNKNIVVYGHAKSPKMFWGLKYLDVAKRWNSNSNYHFVKITTKNIQTVWQIFSWYETDMEYDYRKTSFSSGENFVAYCNKLQNNNKISSFKKFEFNQKDRILTLSTCKGLNERNRVAVHAILIKYAEI